jgi:hypothetical protein
MSQTVVIYAVFIFNKQIAIAFEISIFSRDINSNPAKPQCSADSLGKAALHVFRSRVTPLSIVATLMGWTMKEPDFDARKQCSELYCPPAGLLSSYCCVLFLRNSSGHSVKQTAYIEYEIQT